MYDEGFVVSLAGCLVEYLLRMVISVCGIRNKFGGQERRQDENVREREDRQDERILITRIHKRQKDTVMGN